VLRYLKLLEHRSERRRDSNDEDCSVVASRPAFLIVPAR
jgi:hypothetical protein